MDISLKAQPMPESRMFFHYTHTKSTESFVHIFLSIKSLTLGLSMWPEYLQLISDFLAHVLLFSSVSFEGWVWCHSGIFKADSFLHYCQPLCTDTKYSLYVTCHVPGIALGTGRCTMYITAVTDKNCYLGTTSFLGETCLLLFHEGQYF